VTKRISPKRLRFVCLVFVLISFVFSWKLKETWCERKSWARRVKELWEEKEPFKEPKLQGFWEPVLGLNLSFRPNFVIIDRHFSDRELRHQNLSRRFQDTYELISRAPEGLSGPFSHQNVRLDEPRLNVSLLKGSGLVIWLIEPGKLSLCGPGSSFCFKVVPALSVNRARHMKAWKGDWKARALERILGVSELISSSSFSDRDRWASSLFKMASELPTSS
jgi:hypothetical protein